METSEVIKEMDESIAKYEEELQIMIDQMEDICKNTKILSNENPRVPTQASFNNHNSIHFCLQNRGQRILTEYSNKIAHDLELCGMDSVTRSLKDRQEQLKKHLILEWAYVCTKSSVDVSKERQAKALFLILNTVPCILHAENCMGIKIVTMLLIEGLSEAIKSSTLGEKAAAIEFIAKIENIVNNDILGDEQNDVQWICPLSDDKKEITQITMSNIRTCKFMDSFQKRIDICVLSEP
ncbi:hypothetical protein ACA910_010342 [Epithemia clementina (nom. ined.)]